MLSAEAHISWLHGETAAKPCHNLGHNATTKSEIHTNVPLKNCLF